MRRIRERRNMRNEKIMENGKRDARGEQVSPRSAGILPAPLRVLRFLLFTFSAFVLPAQLHAQPGSVDPSFDPGTGVDQSVFAIAIQSDGRIVIGGDFTTVNGTPRKGVARLNSNGSLDSGFDPGTGPNDLVSAVAVQGDKIIIGGYFTAVSGTNQGYVARLNSN